MITTTAPAQDNAASISIAGTAEANSTVTLSNNGSLVGTTTADGTGHWSVNNIALTDGANYSFTATATDAANNTSGPSNALAFHDDRTPPAAPVITTTAPAQDNAASISIAGTAEANSTVTLSNNGSLVGTTTADGTGHWSVNNIALTDGANYSFTATATDAANNTSGPSNALAFHDDRTLPAAPVITTTAPAQDNAASISIAGTAEANSTVTLSNNGSLVGTTTADGTGHWSVNNIALTDGANYSFTATATDAANNTSGPSNALAFHDDRTPPAAPVITTTAPAQDNAASISIAGTAEANSTVTLSNNGSLVGTTTADGTGHWSVNNIALTDGANYSFTATATDPANNTSGPSNALAFHDSQNAPAAPVITTTAPAQDNAASISIAGTAEANSTVTLSNNGSLVGTTTADGTGHWSVNNIALTDGANYSFTATATDAAKNTSGPSNALAFHDDRTPPAAPVITTTAPAQDNAASISIAGAAEANSTVTLSNNGSLVGTTTADGTGHWRRQLAG